MRCLGLALVLLAIAPACGGGKAAPAVVVTTGAEVATVVEVEGAVTATRAGASRALIVGARVHDDDVIATGSGRVGIELDRNHVVWRLGPSLSQQVAQSSAWSAPMATGQVAATTDEHSAAAGRHAEREAADTATSAVAAPAPPLGLAATAPAEPATPTTGDVDQPGRRGAPGAGVRGGGGGAPTGRGSDNDDSVDEPTPFALDTAKTDPMVGRKFEDPKAPDPVAGDGSGTDSAPGGGGAPGGDSETGSGGTAGGGSGSGAGVTVTGGTGAGDGGTTETAKVVRPMPPPKPQAIRIAWTQIDTVGARSSRVVATGLAGLDDALAACVRAEPAGTFTATVSIDAAGAATAVRVTGLRGGSRSCVTAALKQLQAGAARGTTTATLKGAIK